MAAKGRHKGLSIGVWAFGSTWTTDVAPVLAELGYSSMAQTKVLPFKFGEALVSSVQFGSLQSRKFHFGQARKPEDVWLAYLKYLTERNFATRPDLVILANCHYYHGPWGRLLELAQALNHAGVDVLLVGEPGTGFDQIFINTDIKLRAHDPCEYVDPETHKNCGRQALAKVWHSVDEKSPVLEFVANYLEHFVPTAKLLRLEKVIRSIVNALRKIDVRYPNIPSALMERVPNLDVNGVFGERASEIGINALLMTVFGFLTRENRCRTHLPGSKLQIGQVGNVTTFIGPPNSRKSFDAATCLEQIAGTRISDSPRVKCYSALPRGTDSALVGYEPKVIETPDQICVDGAVAVSFDEAELFGTSVIEQAIALAGSKGIAVFFALYGLHWSGKPANNVLRILSTSEIIVSKWTHCLVQGCAEVATRTVLMSTCDDELLRVPGLMFPDPLVPLWLKKRLGIKIAPACLDHCDQATTNHSFEISEANESKGDAGSFIRMVGNLVNSIMEDAKDGRASAIAFLSVVSIMLLFPDLSYTIWGPLNKILALLASVAFVLTVSAVCDVAISRRLRKKRQKAAYVTLGFATILLLLATLYLGLEPVLTTAVYIGKIAVGVVSRVLEALFQYFSDWASYFLARAELPGEYGRPLVLAVASLLSVTVLYTWYWTRRKKKERRKRRENGREKN